MNNGENRSNAFDVIIIGGGTAGVVAAIQSGRAGASTLLVEKSGVLGGTLVLNAVNFPGLFHAWGRQVIAGIGWELVADAVAETGGVLPDFSKWRGMPHYRLQVRVNRAAFAALADARVVEAGVTLSLHTMLAGAAWHGDRWAVTLCEKEGLREVRCRVLVDCTGDANVVAQAGLPLAKNPHLQPGTLTVRTAGYDLSALDLDALERAFKEAVTAGRLLRSDLSAETRPVEYFLRVHGENSVHVSGIDGGTSRGRTEAELAARRLILRMQRFLREQPGLEHFHYDYFATECGLRETATIVGEVCVSGDDYKSGRLWEDAVCYSFYPIDIHHICGPGVDTRPLREGVLPTIPYRALLPRGSSNLIAAGRNVSGDQEAHSAFRIQASVMAMGQAAGAAAALAARKVCELREVPLSEIHAILREHDAIVPCREFSEELAAVARQDAANRVNLPLL